MIGSYWNHNVHYEPVILGAVPPGCQAALEVGCGNGRLVSELCRRCAMVTGIDADGPVAGQARTVCGGNAVIVHGDFLTYPFREESFDFVCANTVLHHMDLAKALRKMADVLRPGGTLAVVGIAADSGPADYLLAAAATPVNTWFKLFRHEVGPGAPVKDPEMSWREARRTALATLPGAEYRRHLLWRYSLVWHKPAVLPDVGYCPVGDADKLVERRGKHRVRVAARGPDHVVLAQPGVDERPDRRRVTDRGDTADGLPGPFADPPGGRPRHLGDAEQ